MSLQTALLLIIAVSAASFFLGYFVRWLVSLGAKNSSEIKAQKALLEAREEATLIINRFENKAKENLEKAQKEIKEQENKIELAESRLVNREELLDKRRLELDKEFNKVKSLEKEIEHTKNETEKIKAEALKKLEHVSNISTEEGKKLLLGNLEKEYQTDIVARMQKLDVSGNERFEQKARDILTSAIHRLGNSVSSDVMATSITIPSEEIKGKIIGKEGRNIKAFEKETGVELVIDDTPDTVLISSFDPVRRQVARVALENLIIDGRIQPAKIEKEVEKAKKEIDKIIKEKGEKAVYECGIFNLDPRIVSILGRLYFRTSYGQNVLQHSIEVAHIAGMIAAEVGANVTTAKAGALLHDIGKAVDHEIQGTHVEIGRRILQKFGANEDIIKAMQAHHEEYPYETVESKIVQVADAISSSRPGARRDTVENYLKRLSELEAISNSFKGVEKCYALEAGREIRVFVKAQEISDLEAKKMARDIAQAIEKELKYPGEIKVNVIRESRAIEYAR